MRVNTTGSLPGDGDDANVAETLDVHRLVAPSVAKVDGGGARARHAEALARMTAEGDNTAPAAHETRPGSSSSPKQFELDRRKSSSDSRPSSTGSRLPGAPASWKTADAHTMSTERRRVTSSVPMDVLAEPAGVESAKSMESSRSPRRPRIRSPWHCSFLTIVTTLVAAASLFSILHSFASRQLDARGCRMSYMRPSFVHLADFDTEHTRFASKYSLYLYREGGVDEGKRANGVPVLFIPGNAGSYKQVRPIAAEGATYFHDHLRHDASAISAGARNLDFFTVDFNEDITAFHGQTMLDQAEYLNEAVAYILSLYHNPHESARDPALPDPNSVIILGHSMGGIVARTMLIMPNYQANSINTIITMSAPHARPPVSFDADIITTYQRINDYWRQAYSQEWANNNPLWHVTLISIAGGGLDSVVPSDYASLESLVPSTHGFTVFTSTVPTVWTSMDHLAILWCDQFRKVVVKSLYDVIDVNRPAQTKPRAERMRVFRKWYLTGMEDVAERSLGLIEPTTLLTLEDELNTVLAQGERLVLRQLGTEPQARASLLPVPPQGTPGGKRFTLLTDQVLGKPAESHQLDVMFCSIFPLQPGQTAALFTMDLDLFGDQNAPTRLACKSAHGDVIRLPASTKDTKHPFFLDDEQEIIPFSYLQYELEDLQDYQFVAVIDRAAEIRPGFVIAEFSEVMHSRKVSTLGLRRLLSLGLHMKLPAERPLVTDIKIPAVHSSLLAYKFAIDTQGCRGRTEMFAPFIRQYTSDPYESKYFVNVKEADINLHGVSPFMPPALGGKSGHEGVSLQIWTDPSCASSVKVHLQVDVAGSLGKLYMRYRTVFAAFPLLVVALVLRKQFRTYDATGLFVSFAESLDMCLRQSLPLMLLSLTFLSISFSQASATTQEAPRHWFWSTRRNSTTIDFAQNDLLIGTQDPIFWFMVPFIGLICVGVCVAMNYAALTLTWLVSYVYSFFNIKSVWYRSEEKRRAFSSAFAPSTPRRRCITTAVLLLLVATVIPYQFAFLVACLVQIATCARAARFAREAPSNTNYNFFNYAHSLLVLMLWILPINLPILVVWVHNLAIQWLTPFSSHHNVLSIMPFILLVETLTSGKMVPRVSSRLRHFTSVFFFGIAIYAAVYGVSHAYVLHYLVNFVAAWLVAIHTFDTDWSSLGLRSVLGTADTDVVRKMEKTP